MRNNLATSVPVSLESFARDGRIETVEKETSHFYYPMMAFVILAGSLLIAMGLSKRSPQASTKNYNVLGPEDATITITEYSDFECPFCLRFFRSTYPELKRYAQSGKVKFVYKDFPLSTIHRNAESAALASHCAGEQGKFWDYHDALFQHQKSLGQETYIKLARDLALDVKQFEQCLSEKKYLKAVRDSLEEGKEKGVRATPTIFVNDIKLEGAYPIEVFNELIKRMESGKIEGKDSKEIVNEVVRKLQEDAVEELKKKDPPVEMIVLTDQTCKPCNPQPVIEFTRQRVFPTVKVRIVELRSKEGQKLLKQFAVNNLPAYFFTRSIEQATNFSRVKPSLIRSGDLYQIDPSQVESQKTLRPPKIGKAPVKGNPKAPVTIIEFSDFQCPYCGRFYRQTLSRVEKEYIEKGLVKFVYKQFPLTQIHPQAYDASLASLCAHEQGKFWEYHDEIFNKQNTLSRQTLQEAARMVQLNLSKFNTCLKNREKARQVDEEIKEGEKAGVNATPTFFINGMKVSGALSFEELQPYIEEALHQAGK